MVNGVASVTTTGMVTGTMAGLDTVVYTVTNSCGTALAAHPIQILQLPPTGVVLGMDSVCVASQITVYDTVSGGYWFMANNHASIDSSGTITGLQGGADTVFYVHTNYCGSDTANKAIVVNPLPNAGTISGADTLCIHTTVTFTDTASGGVWSAVGSRISVSGPFVTGWNSGADTVQYTVANSCGTAVAKYGVMVQDMANAGSILVSDSVLCVGASATITDTGATAPGQWTTTNATAAISGSMLTGMAAGADTLFYTVSNYCGRDTAYAIVTLKGQPDKPSISGATLVCVNRGNDTLVGLPTGGTWFCTNGNATVNTDGIVVAVSPGPDTAVYTISDLCGAAQDSAILLVPDQQFCDSINSVPLVQGGNFMTVFPNPTTSELNITGGEGVFHISVFNFIGESVLEFPECGLPVKLDMGRLIPGIYLLRVRAADGRVMLQRFCKQ